MPKTSNNRFETYINPTTLVEYEGGFDTWNNLPAGRFKLYPFVKYLKENVVEKMGLEPTTS